MGVGVGNGVEGGTGGGNVGGGRICASIAGESERQTNIDVKRSQDRWRVLKEVGIRVFISVVLRGFGLSLRFVMRQRNGCASFGKSGYKYTLYYRPQPNQPMKPRPQVKMTVTDLATDATRGLSLSR